MTSILLTARRTPPASGRAASSACAGSVIPLSRPSRLLLAVARRDFLFLRVLQRRLLVHRIEQVVVRFDPVRDVLPALAVPLLDAHQPVPAMIVAADLHRRDEPLGTERVDPL